MTRLAVILSVAALAAPAGAQAGVNPQIAGLQVALRAHGLYLAQIDGIAGPKTAAAIHTFQRQHGLPVGLATTRTRSRSARSAGRSSARGRSAAATSASTWPCCSS